MAKAENVGAEKKGSTKARAKTRAVTRTNPNEVTAISDECEVDNATKDSSVKVKVEAVAEADDTLVAEMQENAGAETERQARTELKKVDVTANYNIQKLGMEQQQADIIAASSLLDTLQAIAAEANDYSRRSLESRYSFVAKLFGATTLESVIQIGMEHAKTSYAGLTAYLIKMTELRANLANEFFKRVEIAFASFQSGKD